MAYVPSSLPQQLVAIVQRYGRAGDPCQQAWRQLLERWSQGESGALHNVTWQRPMAQVLTQPHWLGLLAPQKEARFPELLPLIQSPPNISVTPGSRGAAAREAHTAWIEEQSNLRCGLHPAAGVGGKVLDYVRGAGTDVQEPRSPHTP